MLEMQSTSSASWWTKSEEITSCLLSVRPSCWTPSTPQNAEHIVNTVKAPQRHLEIRYTWCKIVLQDSNEWGRAPRWTEALENKMETLPIRQLLSGLWLQLLVQRLCNKDLARVHLFLPLILAAFTKMHWEAAGKCGAFWLLHRIATILQSSFVGVQSMWILYSLNKGLRKIWLSPVFTVLKGITALLKP